MKSRKRSILEVFSGLSVMFITVVFTVGIFFLVLWGARALRTWTENRIETGLTSRLSLLENKVNSLSAPSSSGITSVPALVTSTPAIKEDVFAGLTQSSFTDLFSGVGWLDKTSTDLYHDQSETALVLPPDVRWEKTGALPLGGIPEFAGSARSRCIGTDCLKVDGLVLSFNGRQLSLPGELQGKSLQNLSIASLDSKWVMGVVTKDSGRYNGWVFYFDGSNFEKVLGGDGKFSSSYPGILGFGGSDADWLAIYGSYDGIAYRVRQPNVTGQMSITDISRFFGIRVMENGFEPSVIRVSGNISQYPSVSDVTWYIFSLTYGKPRFMKLFQNGTDEIQGAVNLVPLSAPLQNSSGAVFRPVGSGSGISLLAEVSGGDGEGTWRFDDLGFKKDREYAVNSSNLNVYQSRVHYARIEETDLAAQGAGVKLFFAGDDRVWKEVKVDELYKLSVPGNTLFWRAVFSPAGDNLSSPYFDGISIHYWFGP
jgi:hypothetical protein